MNKTSTAVYILIAVGIILLAFAMSKPAVVGADGKTVTGYIKLWNFKGATAAK